MFVTLCCFLMKDFHSKDGFVGVAITLQKYYIQIRDFGYNISDFNALQCTYVA